MKLFLKLFSILLLTGVWVSIFPGNILAQSIAKSRVPTDICELVGAPVSSPNSSDPTARGVFMSLRNTYTDDIKVHVVLQYSTDEKINYGNDVTLAGTNTASKVVGGAGPKPALYWFPIPLKAPGGEYLVHVTIKEHSLYLMVCKNSGKAVIVEAIPKNDRAITSTLRKVENPAPYSSLGSILTALIPNIFAIAGMLAFAFLVFGGIRYALARGDAKATDSARGVITNAITGLVIILSVFVIFEIITNVFKITIFSLVPSVHAQSVDIGSSLKLGDKPIASIFPNFASLVTAIIAAATALMGLIFFALLIFGGIRYMLARGDEKAIQAARGVLTSAVIGLLIVLGAFAIITLIGLLTGQSSLLP